MIAHIPAAQDLVDAPECAILALLDANLLATEQVLHLVHPTLSDIQPDDPPTVAEARLIIGAANELVRRIERYRIALDNDLDYFIEDCLPF